MHVFFYFHSVFLLLEDCLAPPEDAYVVRRLLWSNPIRHVNITNDLGEGIILSIHCKSRDDDLGLMLSSKTRPSTATCSGMTSMAASTCTGRGGTISGVLAGVGGA
ncbi:hypothetical protein L1049_027217 [Liquidambar formosana]|uniref:Uncharacterized protein n=1 Tax=Liquidambar formosana TaxID=63359 RepID=A0AAP0R276_LIQFO